MFIYDFDLLNEIWIILSILIWKSDFVSSYILIQNFIEYYILFSEKRICG